MVFILRLDDGHVVETAGRPSIRNPPSNPEDLKFYNADLKYNREPDDFVIKMGGNSKYVKLAKVNWGK